MWRERLAALAGGVVIILTAAPAGASAAPGLAADETLTTAQGASPAVAFAPNGFAIAAWTETGNVGVALRPPGGPWSAPQEFTAGSNIEIPSVAVDSGGDAAVTWVDNSAPQASAFVASRSAAGPLHAAESLSDGSSPGPRPAVGIDATGQVTLLTGASNISARTFAAGASLFSGSAVQVATCAQPGAGPLLLSESPSGDAVAGYTCPGAGFALRRAGTWNATAVVANDPGSGSCMMSFGAGPTQHSAVSVAIDSQGHPAALMETDAQDSPCPVGQTTGTANLLVPVSGKMTVVSGPPAATGSTGTFGAEVALSGPAVGVGGGGLVVTWAAPLTGSSGSPNQVHARFFDANGEGGSAVKDVGAQDSTAPPRPALAAGLDGHALLAWAPHLSGEPAVVAAARAPGGDFGAQAAITPDTGETFAPGGAAIDDLGDGVVTYVAPSTNTPHARGFDATPPTLGAVSIPATATAGTPAAFSATASDFWGPLTFGWAFGDGGTDTGPSPSHVFAAAGPFTPTVTVTDAAGNAVSQSGAVQVAAAPPNPALPPVLSGVGETHATFRVGPKPTVVSAGKRAPVGTTFLFTLDKAATVTLSIDRATAGRRSGRQCVKPTRKLRRHKRCTRFVHAGTLTRASLAGADRVPFSGRIGRRKLVPGSYRVTLTPTLAGKTGSPKTLHFKVVR